MATNANLSSLSVSSSFFKPIFDFSLTNKSDPENYFDVTFNDENDKLHKHYGVVGILGGLEASCFLLFDLSFASISWIKKRKYDNDK